MSRVQPDALDLHNLEKFSELYPDVKVRAIRVYQDMWRVHGVRMRCTEAMRSFARQEMLYAQGRTAPGDIVTWARPGHSVHHYGCAFDSCFSGPDPYLKKLPPEEAKRLWDSFGALCEAHGLRWGGNFSDEKKDRPHAQITYGLTVQEISDLHKNRGIIGVFARFDQITGGKNV